MWGGAEILNNVDKKPGKKLSMGGKGGDYESDQWTISLLGRGRNQSRASEKGFHPDYYCVKNPAMGLTGKISKDAVYAPV